MTPDGPVRPSWPAFKKQQGWERAFSEVGEPFCIVENLDRVTAAEAVPVVEAAPKGDQDTTATIFGFWNLKLVRL